MPAVAEVNGSDEHYGNLWNYYFSRVNSRLRKIH